MIFLLIYIIRGEHLDSKYISKPLTILPYNNKNLHVSMDRNNSIRLINKEEIEENEDVVKFIKENQDQYVMEIKKHKVCFDPATSSLTLCLNIEKNVNSMLWKIKKLEHNKYMIYSKGSPLGSEGNQKRFCITKNGNKLIMDECRVKNTHQFFHIMLHSKHSSDKSSSSSDIEDNICEEFKIKYGRDLAEKANAALDDPNYDFSEYEYSLPGDFDYLDCEEEGIKENEPKQSSQPKTNKDNDKIQQTKTQYNNNTQPVSIPLSYPPFYNPNMPYPFQQSQQYYQFQQLPVNYSPFPQQYYPQNIFPSPVTHNSQNFSQNIQPNSFNVQQDSQKKIDTNAVQSSNHANSDTVNHNSQPDKVTNIEQSKLPIVNTSVELSTCNAQTPITSNASTQNYEFCTVQPYSPDISTGQLEQKWETDYKDSIVDYKDCTPDFRDILFPRTETLLKSVITSLIPIISDMPSSTYASIYTIMLINNVSSPQQFENNNANIVTPNRNQIYMSNSSPKAINNGLIFAPKTNTPAINTNVPISSSSVPKITTIAITTTPHKVSTKQAPPIVVQMSPYVSNNTPKVHDLAKKIAPTILMPRISNVNEVTKQTHPSTPHKNVKVHVNNHIQPFMSNLNVRSRQPLVFLSSNSKKLESNAKLEIQNDGKQINQNCMTLSTPLQPQQENIKQSQANEGDKKQIAVQNVYEKEANKILGNTSTSMANFLLTDTQNISKERAFELPKKSEDQFINELKQYVDLKNDNTLESEKKECDEDIESTNTGLPQINEIDPSEHQEDIIRDVNSEKGENESATENFEKLILECMNDPKEKEDQEILNPTIFENAINSDLSDKNSYPTDVAGTQIKYIDDKQKEIDLESNENLSDDFSIDGKSIYIGQILTSNGNLTVYKDPNGLYYLRGGFPECERNSYKLICN
ncbi:hypothetical protein COBT_000007 [Conglomerata obtusa]